MQTLPQSAPRSLTEDDAKRLVRMQLLTAVGMLLYVFIVELSGWLTINNWKGDFAGRSGFLFSNLFLPWCVLAPVVAWLTKRYPITPALWLRRILLHLAGLLTVALLHLAVLAYRYHFFSAPHNPDMAGYAGWQHMGHFLVGDGVLLFDIILYTVVLANFNLLLFFNEWQQQVLTSERLQAGLQQARWQMLRMQVNPHFLFNSLNAIAVLIKKQENETAVIMVNKLAAFLRSSLTESTSPLHSMAAELTIAREYLALEQLRFGARLRVEWCVDGDVEQILIPVLLLQPLLENAIKHGLSEKEQGGVVRISACRANEQLCIRIDDNGTGCNFTAAHFSEGIGLNNVRERLLQHYGDAATLSCTGKPNEGVQVSVHIPCTTVRKKS